MPETMRVFKADGKGGASVLSGVPPPSLRPDYVFIRTVAVALNPTDWKHIRFVTKPVTIGCDFSGVVEEVGAEVTRLWKKGDRVCGFSHGGNVVQGEDGAFGQFLVAKGDILIRVPDDMTFEEAATFPVGAITCGQGMYQSMQLPWPTQPAKEASPILIYGGSTATGALAIQFAKLYLFLG
jgi:NADPH:quinone reductase-like Zn-dependent oxidoreductase